MTLDRLEITGFGKFSNAVIDLQSGLDAREYPNEFGKSTLADFIVFCFYGFEKSRAKKPLRDNQPEKYRPWNQNGAVGGAIEFHTDAGRRYRLERSCDAKGKSKAQIVDESGAVQDIEDAGQYFFGVDRETFLNIFLMRGSGCAPIRTEQTEIAMKNLVVTGDETVSYDSVMQVLQNERSKYVSAKRGMGKLRDLQGHIQDLQTQIVLSENKIEEQARRRPSAEQDERTLKTLEQKIQRDSARHNQPGRHKSNS